MSTCSVPGVTFKPPTSTCRPKHSSRPLVLTSEGPQFSQSATLKRQPHVPLLVTSPPRLTQQTSLVLLFLSNSTVITPSQPYCSLGGADRRRPAVSLRGLLLPGTSPVVQRVSLPGHKPALVSAEPHVGLTGLAHVAPHPSLTSSKYKTACRCSAGLTCCVRPGRLPQTTHAGLRVSRAPRMERVQGMRRRKHTQRAARPSRPRSTTVGSQSGNGAAARRLGGRDCHH